MVENWWNLRLIPYFANAIFSPSKMKPPFVHFQYLIFQLIFLNLEVSFRHLEVFLHERKIQLMKIFSQLQDGE